MGWQIWLIISLFFFILEIATTGFMVFWFGIGGLAAMVTSLFTTSFTIQAFVFIVVSTLLLFATKPLVNKFTKKDEFVKTNAYSIEGKIGKVTKDIESVEGKGQIKVSGEVWSAKSYDDSFIPAGTEVEVVSLNGVKAIVKPFKNE